MMRMRRVLCQLLVVLALVLLGGPMLVSAQGSGQSYTVRPGDTLTSIANRYRTSVEALVAYNKLTTETLQINQVIRIPPPPSAAAANNTSAAPSSEPPGSYTVRPGDTLTHIADRYGVSLDNLMAANKITDPGLVQIGRVLKIPTETAAAGGQSAAPVVPDGERVLSANGGPSIKVVVAEGRLVSVELQTTSTGKQGLPLSCEAKIAAQLATMYGLPFSEETFVGVTPHALNPRRGFVGSVRGRFYWPRDLIGNTANGPGGYGMHVEAWGPVFQSLSGFQVKLLPPGPIAAQAQIDAALRRGYPVAAWAVLGFRENIARNSVWLGVGADGKAIDCGGPGPNCNYLVSGEHAYLILGKRDDSYLLYDPGNGEINYFPRSLVINGITTFFASPTGSSPGAIIIPSAGRVPELGNLPAWR